MCIICVQGGVLSPYLFAYYIDDLIDDVKRSGYGIYKESVFLGCILYADDIILLSGSCNGLQQMTDICVNYRRHWDIKFNATKSQCITFGGNRACSSHIICTSCRRATATICLRPSPPPVGAGCRSASRGRADGNIAAVCHSRHVPTPTATAA